MARVRANLTLSPEAKRLLELLADRWGLSQSAVVEMVIRDRARDESIEDTIKRKAAETDNN